MRTRISGLVVLLAIIGGTPLYQPEQPVRVESREQYLMLMSDLHYGHALTNKGRIRQDLDLARKYKARILINGDVFDAILQSDKKRFDARTVDPELPPTGDLNAAIDMAFRELEPYADLIDLIGCGNHETSVEKYHSFDPISALNHRLNVECGAKIAHGDYCGYYWMQLFEPPRTYATFRIRYHHGFGGAAPVTKGIIDFARMQQYITCADVLWTGHKHNRIAVRDTRERHTKQGRIAYEDVLCVQSAAYQATYPAWDGKGRRPYSWGQEKGFAPQPMGGFLVRVWSERTENRSAKAMCEVVNG